MAYAPLTPPIGAFRVGDYVEVAKNICMTKLGTGRIIDVETSLVGIPVRALVRFENGSVKGCWYSLGSLTRLADFQGRPV